MVLREKQQKAVARAVVGHRSPSKRQRLLAPSTITSVASSSHSIAPTSSDWRATTSMFVAVIYSNTGNVKHGFSTIVAKFPAHWVGGAAPRTMVCLLFRRSFLIANQKPVYQEPASDARCSLHTPVVGFVDFHNMKANKVVPSRPDQREARIGGSIPANPEPVVDRPKQLSRQSLAHAARYLAPKGLRMWSMPQTIVAIEVDKAHEQADSITVRGRTRGQKRMLLEQASQDE